MIHVPSAKADGNPYKNCPNVRPAFTLLNEMKFTNHKLLDLPANLKVDWIDKGYPMQ